MSDVPPTPQDPSPDDATNGAQPPNSWSTPPPPPVNWEPPQQPPQFPAPTQPGGGGWQQGNDMWRPTAPPREPEDRSTFSIMRPLEFGEIMDMGFRLWWRTLKQVFPWSLLFALPIAGLQGYLAYLNSATTESSLNDLFDPSVDPNAVIDPVPGLDNLRVQVGGGALTLILTLIGSVILSGALTAYFAERLLNRDTPIKDCLKVGFNRFFPLLGVAFLSGLSMILGCFALCVGFFFAFTVVSVASQTVVVERAGPIQALKRSYHLTMPRFWHMLGLLLVSAVVTQLMGFVFGLIGIGGTALSVVGDQRVAGAIVSGVAGWLSTAFTTPLSAALLVIAYFDLRVRSEGLDLQLAAQGLGAPR